MSPEQSIGGGQYEKPKTEEELIEEILAVMQTIDDAHESGSGQSLEDALNVLKAYPPRAGPAMS